MTARPRWLAVEDQPVPAGVEPRRLTRAGVLVALPTSWDEAQLDDLPAQTVEGRHSAVPGEGFVAVRLDAVDPGASLATWVEAPMQLLGGLDPQTLVADGSTELLSWGREPTDGLATALGVDEALAYTGQVTFGPEGGGARELLRTYVVLARRGATAWKVALTLASASPPGASAEEVDEADHVRARWCLSGLAFDGDR